MIKFFFIANKVGQLRLKRCYEMTVSEEGYTWQCSLINACLNRKSKECTIFHQEDTVVIFRKYVNLYLIAGVTQDENELSILELMQNFLETLNGYFENVSELDIMFNLDRVYMILDEMIIGGAVAQTSRERILAPLQLLDAIVK